MEFGRVPEHELNKVDFSLPQDLFFNNKVLPGKPAKNTKVYIGCAKWGPPEWAGKIYPPSTKEKDFLQNYSAHYNCIELNATHYKVYGAAGIAKWKGKTQANDFLFCPKMYQGVTHRGKLSGKEIISSEFFRGIRAFGEQLGPVFIQVSDGFSPNRRKELFEYLASLPTGIQFFAEVRHMDWFRKEAIRSELFETLSSLNIGAVITDTAGRRDCAHMHLTIPKTFIRYVGNSLHPSDFIRTDAWIERIKYWIDKGLQELYFFMHMHEETTSPELTIYLIDKINKACGMNLKKPRFVDNVSQRSLFT